VLDFKRLPLLPELGTRPGIAELAGVAVDGARAVNFSEAALHFGELETHFFGFAVRERANGAFVNGPCRGEAEVRGRLGDVEVEHFQAVLVGNSAGRALVDPHGMSREAAVFFQSTVHEVQDLGKLWRAVFYGLFEQVS
jgi:hypothetical protein